MIRGNARIAPGCHDNCGVLMHIKDGKLAKVEGDRENPYKQGRPCSRCLTLPDCIYHPDRLLYPMKRAREDRGKNKFERITWDEAHRRRRREGTLRPARPRRRRVVLHREQARHR